MKMISEKTLIPLGLAVSVIGGAAVWATSIQVELKGNNARVERQGSRIREIDDKIDNLNSYLASQIAIVRQDIAEIKVELKHQRRN